MVAASLSSSKSSSQPLSGAFPHLRRDQEWAASHVGTSTLELCLLTPEGVAHHRASRNWSVAQSSCLVGASLGAGNMRDSGLSARAFAPPPQAIGGSLWSAKATLSTECRSHWPRLLGFEALGAISRCFSSLCPVRPLGETGGGRDTQAMKQLQLHCRNAKAGYGTWSLGWRLVECQELQGGRALTQYKNRHCRRYPKRPLRCTYPAQSLNVELSSLTWLSI